MTLPASGTIAFTNLNTELGRASTAAGTNLNETAVRTLFVKPTALSTIALSDGYGKTYRKTLAYSFAQGNNQQINLNSISGYAAGISDITLTVPANIWVYSQTQTGAGLTIIGGTAGDTLKLVVNGYIIGFGGQGGGNTGAGYQVSTVGSPALSTTFRITQITGTGYIAGGGGGGAGQNNGAGGGGAGGGAGGPSHTGSTNYPGGAGGGLGAPGAAGTAAPTGSIVTGGAGGGGRQLPGSGGTGTSGNNSGGGGGAGGGGSGFYYNPVSYYVGGGGGGWGAAGGNYYGQNTTPLTFSGNNNGGSGGGVGGTISLNNPSVGIAGSLGGAAIKRNGTTAPTVTCTIYGAIV